MSTRPASFQGPHALGAVLVSILFAPTVSEAQLTDATWTETVVLHADYYQKTGIGSDFAVPEPQNPSILGSTYSIYGSIDFDSPGPPNATSIVSAEHLNSLTSLDGTASCQIDFEFRVVETSNPPAPVASVPVIVVSSGSVEADGDSAIFASAFSRFYMWVEGYPVTEWYAVANNSEGQSSDSFQETTQIELPPGLVVSVTLNADASLESGSPQDSLFASATAYVDPFFSVADELIPGGEGSTYSQYYAIQVSDGYWALGQTPVQSTTWGQIKARYH